jgi:hypothetical protein
MKQNIVCTSKTHVRLLPKASLNEPSLKGFKFPIGCYYQVILHLPDGSFKESYQGLHDGGETLFPDQINVPCNLDLFEMVIPKGTTLNLDFETIN